MECFNCSIIRIVVGRGRLSFYIRWILTYARQPLQRIWNWVNLRYHSFQQLPTKKWKIKKSFNSTIKHYRHMIVFIALLSKDLLQFFSTVLKAGSKYFSIHPFSTAVTSLLTDSWTTHRTASKDRRACSSAVAPNPLRSSCRFTMQAKFFDTFELSQFPNSTRLFKFSKCKL